MNIFDNGEELQMIHTNLAAMIIDICQQYNDILDQSHHGWPVIVQTEHNGCRGRPSMKIFYDGLIA